MTDVRLSLAQAAALVREGLFAGAITTLDQIPKESLTDHDLNLEAMEIRLEALHGLGDWDRLVSIGTKCISDTSSHRHPRLICRAHALVGIAQMRRGSMRLAEEHLRAAVHVARWDLEDPGEVIKHLRQLAVMFKNRGLWRQAEHEADNAIAVADDRGLASESGIIRVNLSIVLLKSGRLKRVPELLDSAEGFLRAPLKGFWLLLCSMVRANYLRITGHTGKALELLEPALATCREQKYSREEAITLEYMGDCHLARREHRRALELYEAAMAIAEATAPKGDLVPELCHRMAETLVALGDPNGAILLCERGLRVAKDIGDRYEECATHRPLAMAHRAAGNPRKALRTADEGIELGRSYEIPYELGRTLAWVGEARLGEAGAEEQAFGRRQLWEARAIFVRLGLTAWTHSVDRVLGFAEEPSTEEEPALTALESLETLDRNALRFGLVTCNDAMREAVATVQSVAPSSIPVLICGESGVGKELLAQALHQMSDRRRGPFVAVNCGAIAAGLTESEFFGHERGAFTGAVQNREGLIASADGGTLFLDEIGELPPPVQASLLRVLESGELRAVGRDSLRKVNIRIVAATNANVEELVARGVFRRDLYYRLNGVRVTLPPLRDREEDIRALFRFFWARAASESKKTLHVSDEVEPTLCAYEWPGNVRELKHEIARAVALAADGSTVPPSAFLPHRKRKDPVSLRRERERSAKTQSEREEILRALRAHGGNKADAARSLGGMKRTTLLYKMERLGIRPEEYEASD